MLLAAVCSHCAALSQLKHMLVFKNHIKITAFNDLTLHSNNLSNCTCYNKNGLYYSAQHKMVGRLFSLSTLQK